jgi:hypothetical protein
MRIEFVNHASFLADCGALRLLCDPWLEGTAFDDGWALLSPSTFRAEDWERVTHLWFSHEHPDHFSPASLRAIPEAVRARISVLFQATADHKVVEFCRRLGFGEVRELAPGRWIELAAGVSALCEPWTSGDSWLALRTPRGTLVNLNDCALWTPAEVAGIAAKVGKVDLLATQFSISAWDGNPEDVERLRRGAAHMLDRMIAHAQGLDARWTLPFASFVWFCHEENAYLNPFHNRVEAAAAALRERSRSAPLVLYPGDRWELDAPHDPTSAIARYERDYDAVPSHPLHCSIPVPEGELVELSRGWCTRLREGSDALRLRVRLASKRYGALRTQGVLGMLAGALGLVTLAEPQAWIWVADYEAAFGLSLFHGLRRAPRPREQCDVALSSGTLRYLFQFLWGGDTLQVNARFRELRPGGWSALSNYGGLAAALNRGSRITWRDLFMRRLRRKPPDTR